MQKSFLFIAGLLLGLTATSSMADPGSSLIDRARERAGALRETLVGAPAEDELLPPEQAFTATARAVAPDTVEVQVTPASGYYLYRNRFAFKVNAPSGGRVDRVDLPKGEVKDDPSFGPTEVYHRVVAAQVSLAQGAATAGKVTLEATFQGCSEKKVCYPPMHRSFDVALPAVLMTGAATTLPSASIPAADGRTTSETDHIRALLQGRGFWWAIAAFAGFGLLLSLTPCVLPMVPILSGIIVGSGRDGAAPGRGRAFSLSLAYVLGMAATYAIAGVAAGLSGALLSSALQNPWVLAAFALVFVALALSMFGLYDLRLPEAVQSRLGSAGSGQGGSLPGTAAMGALSALIVSPCVAAPLAGALLYISQTRDVVLGGAALFSLALGMGVPLLMLGLSAGVLLPRAGAWMDTIKAVFGWVLLGVALWLIAPALPGAAVLVLAAALAAGCAVSLLRTPVAGAAGAWVKRAGAVAAFGWGLVLIAGAVTGGRDALHPLEHVQQAGSARPELRFQRVKSVAELNDSLQQASRQGKYVMLDFYADWCASCKEMERETFRDPRVREQLNRLVVLQADVTANDAADQALLRRFGLFGPPGIIFFDPTGQEIGNRRVVGFQESDRFLDGLARLNCC